MSLSGRKPPSDGRLKDEERHSGPATERRLAERTQEAVWNRREGGAKRNDRPKTDAAGHGRRSPGEPRGATRNPAEGEREEREKEGDGPSDHHREQVVGL